MLADGELSAPELLEVYLERIARLDSQLRSYRVVLTDKARDEAYAAQDRLDAGERLPLLGVPIAIKDDVDVAGEVTTCGSAGHRPAVTADAAVVRRLRAAGAVIIGKTAVPELMIFPFTESLTFGATRNPWNPKRTPGGSSGGSAAAVAAGLASLALGSDGGGSIRIPSSWCGLFGLKPQRDRVSLEPHDNAWYGLSVNGPIARSVLDAALFLDATNTVPGPEGEFVAAATHEARQAANCLEHQGPNAAGPGRRRRAGGRRRGGRAASRAGPRRRRRATPRIRWPRSTRTSCPAICAASATRPTRRPTPNAWKGAPAPWPAWDRSSPTEGWKPCAPPRSG